MAFEPEPQLSDPVVLATAHCYFVEAAVSRGVDSIQETVASAYRRQPELIDAIRGYQQAGRPVDLYPHLEFWERTLNDPSCEGFLALQVSLVSPFADQYVHTAVASSSIRACDNARFQYLANQASVEPGERGDMIWFLFRR